MRLSRKTFIAWLQAKHPRTRIGRPHICPIKFFTGYKAVGTRGYVTADHRPGILPDWACIFIARVDVTTNYGWAKITAGQALKLLGVK